MTNRLIRGSIAAALLSVPAFFCCSCHGGEDFSGSGELSKSEHPQAPPAGIAGGAPQAHAPVSVVQRKPHP